MSSIDETYKPLGRISTFPYTNSSDKWLILDGIDFDGSGFLTLAAGSTAVIFQVTDGAGKVINEYLLASTQSAITPTSTVTVYLINQTKRILVPPNGQIVLGSTALVTAVFLIMCNTLKDAMLAI